MSKSKLVVAKADMIEPTPPIAPSKPTRFNKEDKYLIEDMEEFVALSDILKAVSETEVDPNTVRVIAYSDDGGILYDVEHTVSVENTTYDADMEAYNVKMLQYTEALLRYKVALKEWTEFNNARRLAIVEKDIEHSKKRLEKLENLRRTLGEA